MKQFKVVQVPGENTWAEVSTSMLRVIEENLEWLSKYNEDNNLHIVLPNGTGVRVDQLSLGSLAVMPGFGYTEERGQLDWAMSLNGVMLHFNTSDDGVHSFAPDTDPARLIRLSIMRAQKRA